MITEEKNGLKLLRFENLADCPGLKAVVSTRPGGVSPAPYAALNLGYGTNDAPENTLANLKLLCAAAGAPFERTIRMRQVHLANVKIIDGDFEFPAAAPAAVPNTDALITSVKGVPLLALSADCALAVLYDQEHAALGVCHSGWRGALLNILGQTAAAMRLRYGTRPEQLRVGVSPMISEENYPVKEDFIEKLRAFYPEDVCRRCLRLKDGRHHFNLKELLKHQLYALGVKNYEFAHICTYANSELFYSWRRDGENAGHFGLLAYLK